MASALRLSFRTFSTTRQVLASSSALKQRLSELIPAKRTEIAEFRKAHNNTIVGTVSVDQVYGGMRDILSLLTETSLLDSHEGIRYRGMTLFEIQEKLPKAAGGNEPLPEGVFWLLLTGEIPTQAQVTEISKDWASRAHLPSHVVDMLNNFPSSLHPMSQLSAAIVALQNESKFAKAYADGVKKTELWDSCYEDSVDLIAKLPTIAAVIYRNLYRDGKVAAIDPNKDWSANFATMLGYESADVQDMLRMYLSIHADHEGGNVSAHATHLVGSALSDPYLSFAAGINGLAGPLHGLANQEVLVWLSKLKADIGLTPTDEQLKEYIVSTLKAGRVVPGYGHAVLRKTDPRFTVQQEFAQKHLPQDPLFRLVSQLYKVIPPILQDTGKIKNPWPNVDAHSGVLLQYYGIKEMNYYTVLFGVSRAIGVLASLTWDRALGFPIERPKSITTESLKELVASKKQA